MIFGVATWLTDAAVTAGAVTTILGCVTVVMRLCLRFPLVRRFFSWIREGWAEDRAEQLDRTLAFNGTGSFRADMREFYLAVNAFMVESAADRAHLHRKVDSIPTRGEP